MPEQLEITSRDGQIRVVPMAGDELLLGSGPAATVRLDHRDLEPLHLRFVRTAIGVRVEPVRPGGTIEVNGQALFCKDLEPGDRLEVAGLQMRWIGDRVRAAAPSAPAAPGRGGVPRGRPVRGGSPAKGGVRERPRRPAGMPSWVPVVGCVAFVLVAALLTYRAFAGSTWPQSPQHYVDLARAQLGNHQPQRALDTLAFALRDATGATREEAVALEAEIRRMQVEVAELPRVQAARQEHDLLSSFVGRYLRDGAGRPAARECVRLCDQWLARHGELCRRHSQGRALVQAVEEHRSRHAASAALDQVDTAEDVIFAARSRLRFQWRDYRGALQRLDEFLRRQPDETAVRAERDKMVAEGEEWLREKLRILDGLIARGDADNAGKDLAQIEQWSMLPEWEGMVKERRQRLDAGR